MASSSTVATSISPTLRAHAARTNPPPRVAPSPPPAEAREARRGKRAPPEEKVKLAPMQTRTRLSENYEQPVSGRENWWRSTIRETPIPGSYSSGDFIDELQRRPNTYRFRSDGRKMKPQPQIGSGEYLLPGAYEHQDLGQRMEAFNATYGFKDTSRESRDVTNFGKKDKDVDVSPDAYQIEKYQTLTVDKAPSKFWQFKSGTQRFPTIHFKPKEGPAPGNYESNRKPSELHAVSSSFKSKTPRFATSHTKVPGPGTYDKTLQSPSMPSTISKMGRIHGIFFSSAFQV